MASSPPPESHPSSHTSPQQLGSSGNKELLAPAGWQKKITSTTSGGTPRRGAVYFIAPDGKEIKSKRSLEGYLKSYPGGPSVTDFDWSTGETPRRSSRLDRKTPVTTPESGSGRKRVRRKVAVEDEAPADKERVGVSSARADEVMEDVEKLEDCEAVETVELVDKIKSDVNEVEKIAEKTDEHKVVECALEVKTEKAQTVEMSSEVGMEGKEANVVPPIENGPVEELVKQEEFGGEKVQAEKGKPEMEETPVVEMSKEAKCGGEVTDNGNIGSFEEQHKQEGSEKPTDGLSQQLEAPETSRPIGVSV